MKMMDIAIAENLIDTCAVAMLLLSLLAMTAARMTHLINTFALQSLFLVVLAFIVAYSTGHAELYIMGITTFAVKAVLIPWFLIRTLKRVKTGREVDVSIGIPGSLMLSAVLIIISYLITYPLMGSGSSVTITKNCIAISMSIILIGMLMMTTRRKAVTQATGLLTMENGLFLGVMSISYGMPLIVELGIFFDVLLVAVILGIFAFRMSIMFDSTDTSVMRGLKD